jgi:RimJ/RimL family protein N-acetyltransferase
MLRLRPVEDDDVRPLAELLSHPGLIGRRGLDGDRPVARSASALAGAVESLVDPKDGDAWIIDVDGTTVGLATVGWWWDALTPWGHVVVDPDHQRRGYGLTAVDLVLDHLFQQTVALLVEYSVPSWDSGGLAFADSVGGGRTGIRRRTGIRDGRYVDTIEFAIEREQWEVRRGARG